MADETKIGTRSGQPEPPEAPVGRPQHSAAATAFANEAQDLKALRNAVVDAANVGATLWFSYLFVLVYLVVAVGSVTHRNLLFESPVKLPFLNVDLPLIGFFALGPGLFLIVHAYVLLHFALLAGKVGVFHTELQTQIADENARARLRRQLPSNIFVQFLAGPVEVRTGIMGAMLRLIAWISLVAGPLALLVFFQFQFLPYHHEAITWWQRLAVVIDLALLWMLWPSVARGETISVAWSDFRRWPIAVAALVSLLPIFMIFFVGIFPGERLEEILTPKRWNPLHQLLVAGDIDLVARKPTSLWSNRLVLPGIEVPHETFSLRGRRLEGAVLLSARLTKVDFTAAQLRGAVLNDAELQEAKFLCAEGKLHVGVDAEAQLSPANSELHCAQLANARLDRVLLQGAKLDRAHLPGASLNNAQLQGATLDNANLQGATLHRAQLQGASLNGAQLQGATLDFAQLQGATFAGTQLQGARLDVAQLQGATFEAAQLQGATLESAQLEGARLLSSGFEGAFLKNARLEGAFVDWGTLEGATLEGAKLQGATFQGVQANSASLNGVMPWRTIPPSGTGNLLVELESKNPEPNCTSTPRDSACARLAASYAELKRRIEEQVPERYGRVSVLQRIAILDPAKSVDEQRQWAEAWARLEKSSPTRDIYEEGLATSLRRTGCAAGGAPHVIRGLLRNLDKRFESGSSHPAALAKEFLDEAKCAGARGLSVAAKAELQEIRDRPAQPLAAPAGATPKQ